MSDSHEASYSVHLGVTGSVSSCLWEGFPPPHLHGQHWLSTNWSPESLRTGSVGVQIQLGKAGMLGQTGRWSTHCIMERDGEGLSVLPSPFSLDMLVAQKMLTFHSWRQIQKALCHLKKQSLLARCPYPWEPSQLQRPGPEYVLQTAGWEVTNCRLLAWLIQQLLEKIFEQLEKLVISLLTVGPWGAIQPVTYYNELSRAGVGTFCSMLHCWQEIKNGKSEQAKPSLLHGAMSDLSHPPLHLAKSCWRQEWSSCRSSKVWPGVEPHSPGMELTMVSETLLLNVWHQVDVTKRKFLFFEVLFSSSSSEEKKLNIISPLPPNKWWAFSPVLGTQGSQNRWKAKLRRGLK